jgi:hypothetical protein
MGRTADIYRIDPSQLPMVQDRHRAQAWILAGSLVFPDYERFRYFARFHGNLLRRQSTRKGFSLLKI